MFTTFIVKPIFNLLVLIYGLLPGHNFGLALIIFTIVIRLLLWPLLKKQLHQTKLMRKLQPEIKRIKKETKGNKQKEMQMTMELYKEKGFNPYASFPTLILQFIVLIGLYSGLTKVIHDPHNLVTFAYTPLQHLPYMKELAGNIHMFDNTLFGIVDLGKSALNSWGVYWPAMIIVVASAVTQYFQSKQLLPRDKDARSLRQILKTSGKGPQPDQSEVNAAVGRSTIYLLPVMIFVITVRFASALSLYWFVGGLVAYLQQSIVLKEDETELEAMADKPNKKDVASIPEAEIVETPSPKSKSKKKKSSKAGKKSRK
jgi:YidC/Oxa1 family membrane protein insertase